MRSMPIVGASISLLLALAACGSAVAQPLPECEWCGALEAPADAGATATIAPADEPGERLTLSGVVYAPDGKTPAAGVVLYVYHTDATGRYSRGESLPGNGRRHGKLRGWVKTGADGKYELRTIRPAPYPGGREPAHIHTSALAPGTSEVYLGEFTFMDDPFVPQADKDRAAKEGRLASIVTLVQGSDDVWRGERDLVLKAKE